MECGVNLCDRYSVLPDLYAKHIVSINPCLTPGAVGNCSPGNNKPQRGLVKGYNILYSGRKNKLPPDDSRKLEVNIAFTFNLKNRSSFP